MNMKKAVACMLAMTLVLGIPAVEFAGAGVAKAAEAATPSVNSQEMGTFLDRFFSGNAVKNHADAIAVSVVKDGSVLAEKGYGVTDRVTKKGVDTKNTTFRVGSVSKVFTVIGLMQLVDQGKVSLSDNIEKYLGGYKLNNPFNKPVTVEMLLTHSTGFEVRDPTEANILFDTTQKPVTLKESIFSNFPPVVREPGTSYMYDNFASELVGYIVQEVSGEPFNDYMIKHVFAPLGMTSSGFDMSKELVDRLPTDYDISGNKQLDYILSPEVLPEGSMITTAEDMSRFMIAFLQDAKAPDGKAILSKASLEAMETYHLSINSDVPDMTYGFEAPMLTGSNGRHIIAKGGSIPGFESYLFMIPDQNIGVFVSASSESELSITLFSEFMNQFYPGKSKFGDSEFKAKSGLELKKFEGIYTDLRISKMLTSIQANEDGTLTSSNNAGVRMKLKQVGELLFVDEAGNPMAFKADDKGDIAYIKYSNPGSYAAKIPPAQGFVDVPKDHPYARYIYGLESLGIIAGDLNKPFGVEEKVTREAFVHEIIHQFAVPPSSSNPIFKDVGDSPYKAEIQVAYEMGLLSGTGIGRFEPNRFIKREEAAVFVMKLLKFSGYQNKESKTTLAAGTSKWAEESVKGLIDLKIHGPEVTVTDGTVNYNSKIELNKQELAAIMYLLLLPEKSLLQ
ncbi:MAG: serine hydrolase [Paenibacillus sp.]|nr:serine hydrolase [Paenibacillus sp.]